MRKYGTRYMYFVDAPAVITGGHIRQPSYCETIGPVFFAATEIMSIVSDNRERMAIYIYPIGQVKTYPRNSTFLKLSKQVTLST